jgi:hypothetical protein
MDDKNMNPDAGVHAERRSKLISQIEAELLRGIQSGPSTEITAETWAELRHEVAQQIVARRQSLFES